MSLFNYNVATPSQDLQKVKKSGLSKSQDFQKVRTFKKSRLPKSQKVKTWRKSNSLIFKAFRKTNSQKVITIRQKIR